MSDGDPFPPYDYPYPCRFEGFFQVSLPKEAVRKNE